MSPKSKVQSPKSPDTLKGGHGTLGVHALACLGSGPAMGSFFNQARRSSVRSGIFIAPAIEKARSSVGAACRVASTSEFSMPLLRSLDFLTSDDLYKHAAPNGAICPDKVGDKVSDKVADIKSHTQSVSESLPTAPTKVPIS